MAKITGLGGVFLKASGDVKRLLEWYRDVLDLDVSEYGINFLTPNVFTLITFDNNDNAKNTLNFTVDNLTDFMAKVNEKGVKTVQEIQAYEYGKFAQIEDVLGNTVELWEPFSDAYKTMVEKEIKQNAKEHDHAI